MMRNISIAVLGVAGLAIHTSANAQTVIGTIDSTIELTAACEVNGSTGTNGVDFGTLDFGSHSTFFTQATTQLQSGAGNTIEIRCSPGADATLTFASGNNDGEVNGSGRAMAFNAHFVPYDIYSDAGFQNVLDNDATIPVTADGTMQDIPIYGRALGASGLVAGTYTDTISVTLGF
ncbi:Csu type fimbrial protein [Novosphingobium album (ex Liu et al. 2023)]|uniref:Spore coat U domain-containing protein n=1 Tax=Novosphingobium album (ex Liu et al. 2023) TaxID=3031130 RepID=A0ABT5WR59_9SPHN|nr:spore coat U domain-containing protein [Novosphingobium album (ex Liu et al. 2023)]MDE8652334.1 spore coat U domain-containing protein [Novosphingobium album (ex Liu et al. 2023)]